MRQYHAMNASAVVEEVGGDALVGLTAAVAAKRLSGGRNELSEQDGRSMWRVFLAQFVNPLMAVIGGAVVVSMIIGHMTDAIFILVIIIINAVVGFIQEAKAERALVVLRASLRFHARVLRDGRQLLIDSAEVVVGDLLILQPGDRIAADARIVSAMHLRVAEAALSGESQPIDKVVDVQAADIGMTDRINMVYGATVVQDGTAHAIVVATGAQTQIGMIAEMIGNTDERQSPLQSILQRFTYWMTAGLIVIVAIFSIIGWMRGGEVTEVLMTAVALVVSAVPEGLLPAVTVVLVVGMRRLARGKALVRKLSAVEAMGAISVICMDKTGTLTTGKMRAQHVFAGQQALVGNSEGYQLFTSKQSKTLTTQSPQYQALAIAMMVNDATVADANMVDGWDIMGRPTDSALLHAGLQSGLRPEILTKGKKEIDAVLFSSARKYATRTMVLADDETATPIVYTLGAPEVVMKRCQHVMDESGQQNIELTESVRNRIAAQIVALAARGQRVLACATDTTLVGIITLADPARTDVAVAIKQASQAGVRPIVITGDHLGTAEAILADVGLEVRDGESMIGDDVDALDDVELAETVRRVVLFARVLPAHKIRIVRALMRSGETVAMVGDGVNDAPALKAADVGIVVGSGTDLAKTVADIVLLDDSFATIVRAIRQGRQVFANVRRVILFLLADDFSELVLFFVALMLGMPMPLLSAQILWINVIEDGLPSMALTASKSSDNVMKIPPQSLRQSLISGAMRRMMGWVFVISSAAAVGLYLALLATDMPIEELRTMLFVLMSLDSLLFVYIVLTLEISLFSRMTFSNQWLNGAVAISFALLIIGVYFPPAQQLLSTVPLSLQDWGIIVIVAIVETLLLEWVKQYTRDSA